MNHPSVDIRCGDCRDLLREIPAASIHSCITSPPYWGLRDYGAAGQIGLEENVESYVAELVAIFQEVRRVLRKDGTLWLNLGDTYAANRSYQVPDSKWGDVGNARACRVPNGLKPKDLIGVPWRVALALQAAGWYLRSDIIWAKGNPMPESCRDRPTRSHEYLFLLTKRDQYFYDQDAIREPCVSLASPPGNKIRVIEGRLGAESGWNLRPSAERAFPAGGRNKRDVWFINTRPYPGAHFATFPPALVEPCILAGTSEHGACAVCGTPWGRITERGAPLFEQMRSCGADANGEYHGAATKDYQSAGAQDASAVKARILEGMRERKTIGWRSPCDCLGRALMECTVLDPFFGAGTVGLVAQRLGRRAIGIELNPDYCTLARERLGMETT